MQCFAEQGHPSGYLDLLPLEESGIYGVECAYGHEGLVLLQEQKFEVLFELSLSAIVDGYNRDSVGSFAASLERFFEFYVRVVCCKRRLQPTAVTESWNAVSKQSERQFGAFVFAYLLENGAAAPRMPEKCTQFRNDVIHRGRFPSRNEALEFGTAVLGVIYPVLATLVERDGEHVDRVSSEHVLGLARDAERLRCDEVTKVATMSLGTTLSIARAASEPQPDLVGAVRRIEERRRIKGW